MADPSKPRRFPSPPQRSRHLYAVARFDGDGSHEDPTEHFVLTRGFWTENEANEQAKKLNAEASRPGSRYFVLPLRVEEG
jgi:hypothetical protein